MERIVALGLILAMTFNGHVSSEEVIGAIEATDGRVGIGAISGGHFGPGSFSIGASGVSLPEQNPTSHAEDVSDSDGDDDSVYLQNQANNDGKRRNSRPPKHGARPINNAGGDNGILLSIPAGPQRAQTNLGQGGKGGQGGRGGGQIVIGTVLLPDNKKHKGNDGSALDAIYNGDQGGNIQIGSITGGNFEQEKPIANNKKSTGIRTPNNGKSGHSNTENEALYSIGHGLNSNGNGNAGDGNVNGHINSGYGYGPGDTEKQERWVWGS